MKRNDSIYQGFANELKQILEDTINDWFYGCQEQLGINAGDVTPDEQFEYDVALEKLCTCCRDMLKNQDDMNEHMPVNRYSIIYRPDFISCADDCTGLAKLRDAFWQACDTPGNLSTVCKAAYEFRLHLKDTKYDLPDEVEKAYEWLDKTVQYYIECIKEEIQNDSI